MQYMDPETPQELGDRTRQLGCWAAPFVIGLVLFLIMLAVYSVRPLLRWLGLL